jgi:hypothetical protein
MKFNLDFILRYLRKYKFILLVAFVLIIILLNFKPIREGLTGASIGEYDYLAPPAKTGPANNPTNWSQQTIDAFISKYDAVNNFTGQASWAPTDEQKARGIKIAGNGIMYMTNATEAEANYYIQNGHWPYDGYVTKMLTQNPGAIGGTKDNISTRIQQYQEVFPNRYMYMGVLSNKEKDMTPTPLSYQIYMGTAQPPSTSSSSASSLISSSTSSLASSSPSSLVSSSPSSSDSNYQQFISLCKNVLK